MGCRRQHCHLRCAATVSFLSLHTCRLSENEKRWIRLRTAQLADVTMAAMSRIWDRRLLPLNELGAFADAGHGVCNKTDPYVNGISIDDTSSSFHPTTAGYAQEVKDLLATAGTVVP